MAGVQGYAADAVYEACRVLRSFIASPPASLIASATCAGTEDEFEELPRDLPPESSDNSERRRHCHLIKLPSITLRYRAGRDGLLGPGT